MTFVTDEAPASTDGRRQRGDSTRRAILGRSMRLASAGGLESLSIARLADDLGMSKSGLFAHFGSKEELQLSTIRAARRVFSDEAVTPALAADEGLARLDALMAAWQAYIANDTFPGGCVLMEAAAEFDARPGAVRDLVAETMGMWMALLVEEAEHALEQGELAAGTDPRQLALGAARVRPRAQLGPPALRRPGRAGPRGRRGARAARGGRDGEGPQAAGEGRGARLSASTPGP